MREVSTIEKSSKTLPKSRTLNKNDFHSVVAEERGDFGQFLQILSCTKLQAYYFWGVFQ